MIVGVVCGGVRELEHYLWLSTLCTVQSVTSRLLRAQCTSGFDKMLLASFGAVQLSWPVTSCIKALMMN